MLRGLVIIKNGSHQPFESTTTTNKRKIDSDDLSSQTKRHRANDDDHDLAPKLSSEENVQRESWMLAPPPSTKENNNNNLGDNSNNKQQTKETSEDVAKVRELNPYFANGGNGLPPGHEKHGPSSSSSNTTTSSSSSELNVLSFGASSWRQKALLRAQERAIRDGGNVDDYLRNNWGVTSHEMKQSLRQTSQQPHASSNRDDSRVVEDWRSKSDDRRSSSRNEKDEYRRIRSAEFSASYKSKMKAPEESLRRKQDDESRTRRRSSPSASSSSSSSKSRSSHYDRDDKNEVRRDRREDRYSSQSRDKSDGGNNRFSQFSGEAQESRLQVVSDHPATSSVSTTQNVTSEEELNKLAARAMKAKIMGNMDLHDKLIKELEEKKKTKSSSVDTEQEAVVTLPTFDDKGRRIRQEMRTLTSQSDLETIVRETKEGGVEDFDHAMLKKMGENTKYGRREWDDEYDDTAEGLERFGTRNESAKGLSSKRMEEKRVRHEQHQKSKQIKEYNTQKNESETCQFCFKTSKTFKRHMVVALGDKAFLMLSPFGSFVDGHCIITTFQHQTSMRDTDEDEWYEIQRFKQSLKKMFASQNRDVLFIETVTPYCIRKNKHAYIECIPIPMDAGAQAPGFFKKAILECDTEYSENSKLIDTRGRGIKKSIPKEFPYFHVEFGINGGYAHVIEDESKFSFLLGRQVVCGLLRRNANEAKLRTSHLEQEKTAVLRFVDQFKEFDWTVELDGGGY